MDRIANSIPLASIAAGVMVFGFAAPVNAGQFKTLNTQNLGVGGSVQATSSPKNSGQAMEMEVFEFGSAAAGGTYSCRILANATGRTLNMRMVAANGTIPGSCSAAPGGTCSTPPTPILGNLKFQCLVTTSNGAPVIGANPTYLMSVNRS